MIKEMNYETFKDYTIKEYLRRNPKPNKVTANGQSAVVSTTTVNTNSSTPDNNIANEEMVPE